MPALSFARTRSWCEPADRFVNSAGEAQELNVAASRAHSNEAPGSLEESWKVALVLADGPELTPADLDLDGDDIRATLPLAEAKEQFAFTYIMETLERNGGNRTQAAKDLGVDPRTIFRYLEKDI